MFGTVYDDLWRRTLYRIAQSPDGKRLSRKHFTRPLTPIRILRNRVAHHEPIIYWSLRKHHDRIVELTEWLAPAAAACAGSSIASMRSTPVRALSSPVSSRMKPRGEAAARSDPARMLQMNL
jgi:hypothetical protein